MPEQIRFTEGLSRRPGAPLAAPYDLTDALLRDGSGVEAVLPPRNLASDTPPTPASKTTFFRQGGKWAQALAEAQKGRTRYVTRPDGQTPALEAFRGGTSSPNTQLPRITDVTVTNGGGGVNNPFDDTAENWPRYVYYLLVPINDSAEAGPFAYVGAKVPYYENVSDAGRQGEVKLPRLSIQGNDFLRWIAIYRTPAFLESGTGSVRPAAQAFYAAERIGVGGEGLSGGATDQAWTTFPGWDEWSDWVFLPNLYDPPVYWDRTNIDHIYLSTDAFHYAGGILTAEDLSNSAIGWRVQFGDLPSGSPLSTGTKYKIYDSGLDGGGPQNETPSYRFFIQNTDGTSVSFDGDDVLDRDTRGMPVELFPPSGQGSTNVTAVYSDHDNWMLDVGKDQKEDFTPPTDVFDRPFNTFASEGVSTTVASDSLTVSQTGSVRRPRGEDLHYQGGTLYMGAPQWPTKRPYPIYLETDASDGHDIRLQYEYALPSGRVLGPPLELSNVDKLSVAWQGAERAVNVFAKSGTPKYEVDRAVPQVKRFTIPAGAPSWFDNELSAGDVVTLGGYTETEWIIIDGQKYPIAVYSEEEFEVLSKQAGSFDVATTAFGQDDTVIGNALTTLSERTENTTTVKVNDASGQIATLGRELILRANSEFGIVGRTIASTSHSSGVTTITTSSTVPPRPKGHPVEVRGDFTADQVSLQGNSQLFVSDPEDFLTDGTDDPTSGDTVTVEGGPNAGTYTLASGPVDSNQGRTRIPVQEELSESEGGGVMLWTGGTLTNWALYRQVTVGPSGQFVRDGSTFVFDADDYTQSDLQGRAEDVRVYAERVRERDAAFFSNVNRPLEITFDQFEVPEGEEIRAIFRARLAEEEGIRAYRFYVGTGESIYVGNPGGEDRAVSVSPVTTSFGVGRTEQGRPAHAFVPGGVVMKATSGHLHVLSGRQSERMFPDGQVPWSSVRDLAYDREEEMVLIATDTGLWGFDRDRQGLASQHDLVADQLVWDYGRDLMLAYDSGASAWRAIHWEGWPIASIDTSTDVVTLKKDRTSDFSSGDLIEVGTLGTFEVSGVSLSGGNTDLSLVESISSTDADYVQKYADPTVQAQEITHGGAEVSFEAVRADYRALGYDVSDKSTFATLTQDRRRSGDSISIDMPRGYDVYPALRGVGLQLSVSGFTELTELRIEGVEQAR